MAGIGGLVAAGRAAELKKLEGKAHGELAKEDAHSLDHRTWPPHRQMLYKVINNPYFDAVCGVVILFNMFLVVIETDAVVDGEDPPAWLLIMVNVLLAIYTIELIAKMYIYRQTFWNDKWNNLDFVVVGIDWVLIIIGLAVGDMPSVSILRVFRLVRLGRALKAASFFHELNALIRSFSCAFKAICWGILMIMLCLVIWAILAVQLIHPVNQRVVKNNPAAYDGCDRCGRAFSSVFMSMLTLFQQLVAGDAWAEVSAPIIEEAPWTSIFFLMVLMTVSLTMLNLILTVILEAGAAAAAEDEHDTAMQMHKKVLKAEKRLIELCERLDLDGSGALNVQEFMDGFENNKEFKDALQVMHVNEADIQMIFNICDEDGSGDVNYHEFVEQLRRIKDSGEKMLLYYVTDVRHTVTRLKVELGLMPTKRDSLMEQNKPKEKVYMSKGKVKGQVVEQPKDQSLVEIPKPPSLAGLRVGGSPLAPQVEEQAVAVEQKAEGESDQKEAMSSRTEDSMTTMINDMQKQMLGILQSIPTKVDTMNNTQLDQIVRTNEDLVAILQQSKVQTGLLNTLVQEFLVVRPPAPRGGVLGCISGSDEVVLGGANLEMGSPQARQGTSATAAGGAPGCCSSGRVV